MRKMSKSIAQTRQQLSAMIDLAQSTPQVITKHNTPIAVLVSTEYFNRTESAAHRAISFYNELLNFAKHMSRKTILGSLHWGHAVCPSLGKLATRQMRVVGRVVIVLSKARVSPKSS